MRLVVAIATAAAIAVLAGCAGPGPDSQSVRPTEPDVKSLLGRSVRDIPGNAHALVRNEYDRGLLDPRDSLDPRHTAKVPDFRVWRRILTPVTFGSGQGSVTRLVVVRYRVDIDRVWYVQAPVEPDMDRLRFGELATNFTFDDCVRRLGPPHRTIQKAPVIRIAWWDLDGATYRVEFFSDDHKEAFRETRKRGSLNLLAVYQRELAPDGFDDGYEIWKELSR